MSDLTVQRHGGVARVTLDRPPLNILTSALIDELGAAFRGPAEDSDVRVVVLGAAGRAFSAGVEVLYETRDGHLVLSMSPLPALQRALDLPALARYATVPYNFAAREEIARLLEPVMRTRTNADWLDLLVPQGVWAAPVRTLAEAFADPAVQAADVVEEFDHPVAGRVRLLRFPVEAVDWTRGGAPAAPDAGRADRRDLARARLRRCPNRSAPRRGCGVTPGMAER